jgi:tRNA(Ile)-lysidine synthase TilS/MesJ
MISVKDIVGYKKGNDVKSVVLEEMLNFVSKKYGFNIAVLPNAKISKIALISSLDSESAKIISVLINGKSKELKSCFPISGKEVKPLYLFLDEEIILFAKLKGLKFKDNKQNSDKIKTFIGEMEKNHPEVKRAIVNSFLKLNFK